MIDDLVPDFDKLPPELQSLVRYVRLMEAAFRIPLLRTRVGIDALIGLIPWAGDVVGAGFSLYVLAVARRHGVPTAILLRMVLKTAVDLGFGSIPFIGDLFDLFYRDKLANLRLLVEHRTR